jgi:Tol biopolymer transport system component
LAHDAPDPNLRDRPAPDRPGDTIDHYRISGELGRGGMGIVYRARDLNLDREVALKRPWPERALDEVSKRRFLREAKATSRLLHPGVVSVFEVLEHDGQPWMVMELVDGSDLGQLIREQGALPAEKVLRFGESLASALEFAHRSGVLHRDIKPRNVLVDKEGRARLTDFGLARFFVPLDGASTISTASSSLTREGGVVGTPNYMSPEQALGRAVDQRSDIFSFGALLYEMCTGAVAFCPTDQGDVVDSILHREPAPVSQLNYEIPQDLEHVVRKCLAKRPDERYQSAKELLVDLRALRRKVDSSQYSTEEPPAPKPGRRGVAVAVASAAVIAIAVVTWIFWPPHPPEGLPLGTVRQLTSEPGWEAEAAISPDGTAITYASDQSGNEDIWVIDARGGQPLRLTDDPAPDRNPAWMPDGSEIVYVSSRGAVASIWKTSRFGGPSTLVVENARNPAPAPDGRRIAFTRADPSGVSRIAVAPLSDPGAVRVLTSADQGSRGHRDPAWSPDGKTLCYSDLRDLWLVPASGGPARQLTDEGAVDVEPVWSPDGRRIYFASYREGTFALWSVTRDGGEPQRLTHGAGPERGPTVSGNGSRMAYSTFLDNPDIVLLDRRSGELSRLASLRNEVGPAFSPDGRTLVFVTDRWGQFSLGLQRIVDGVVSGPPSRLTDHPGSCSHPTFSPDGEWITYYRVLERQRDIWIVAASGGIPVRVTRDEANDIHPAWSPDGTRIAFASDREGRSQIWLLPVRNGSGTGPPERLTFGETSDSFPAWSPDGDWIAYVGELGDAMEVWIVPSDGSAPPRQVTDGARAQEIAWHPVGSRLLVGGRWESGVLSVRSVPLDGTDPVPIDPPISFGTAALRGDFAVAMNGRLIAYVEQATSGDIWVLETDAGAY